MSKKPRALQEYRPSTDWLTSTRTSAKKALSHPLLVTGLALSSCQNIACSVRPHIMTSIDQAKASPSMDFISNDRESMLRAIETDALQIQLVDDSLWNDDAFVDRLIKRNIQSLAHLPVELRNSSEFIGRLMQKDPRVAAFMGNWLIDQVMHEGPIDESSSEDEYLTRRETMKLAAIEGNRNVLRMAEPRLLQDVEFWIEITKINPDNFQYADESIRGEERLVHAYLESKIEHHKVDKLISDLKKHHIKYPERFDIETLEKILSERERIATPTIMDERPLALYVITRKDWNQGFQSNFVPNLVATGFRTLYFEASSEQEVYSAIRTTESTGKKISILILGGHGSRETIAFGADDPRFKRSDREKLYIDIGDETELKIHKERFLQDATIILQSCSTGEGREGEWNVANTFHRAFPQTRIFSATSPTAITKIKLDRNRKVIDVAFDNDPGYTVKPTASHDQGNQGR